MIVPEKPVYVDANVFIYAMETDGEEGLLARRWLHEIDRGCLSGVTSALTGLEVLPHPIATGDSKLVDAYRRLLTDRPMLRVVTISDAVVAHAADLRALLGLTAPDALYVATALGTGCAGFLTNDGRLRLPPELVRYSLSAISLLDR